MPAETRVMARRMIENTISTELLVWYDAHARVMPWRVGPADRKRGIRPDPYRVWLSEVMLQQTTVAAVKSYFEKFTGRWPTVSDLAAAADEDVMAAWAGLGYYARARNLLKCARIVSAEHNAVFPDTYERLIALPGIGPYTAAAISAIAYDRRATVVDGNVERVMARLHMIERPVRDVKPRIHALADAVTPDTRSGDYAQAIMDLGATICTPKSPACGICPWVRHCMARAENRMADLPAKPLKKKKPTRYGSAYLARRSDGAWLLERRPGRGLLGGMLAWPTSDWAEVEPASAPPIEAEWIETELEVRHTFTHFHLILRLSVASIREGAVPHRGSFLSPTDFLPTDLPTVMRKAYDLASDHPALH